MGSITSMCRDLEDDNKGLSRCAEEVPKHKYAMEDKTDDKITEAVVADLRLRSKVGIKKYNTTLDKNNKDDYMIHLYQELLDAAQYAKKEMSFIPMIKQMIKDYPNDMELGKKIRETFNG
jgi:hypothetical protein